MPNLRRIICNTIHAEITIVNRHYILDCVETITRLEIESEVRDLVEDELFLNNLSIHEDAYPELDSSKIYP